MKNFIKKSVHPSRNTQIKDKLIRNTANIVFFSQINRIFSVKNSKEKMIVLFSRTTQSSVYNLK